MKATWCANCQHTDWDGWEIDPPKPCKKGHGPRHYKPQSRHDDHGFKRRCEDFVLGDHVIIIRLAHITLDIPCEGERRNYDTKIN